MMSLEKLDPLDILWDNIQLQYAAIIRAQRIMYVKDQWDSTTTKIEEKDDNVWDERWEVQQDGDKHATFLNAQSRAMKTLEGMIKQYDELLQIYEADLYEINKSYTGTIRHLTQKTA